MKYFVYTVSLLALITVGGAAFAHGAGGDIPGAPIETKTPAYKFNIATPDHAPAPLQQRPGRWPDRSGARAKTG